jgi:branched-chain amino acid aminotransferase
MSIMEIAVSLGMKVEKRAGGVDELGSFDEVGSCGTAVVISPISQIDDPLNNRSYKYSKSGESGTIINTLYEILFNTQFGLIPDTFGWTRIL